MKRFSWHITLRLTLPILVVFVGIYITERIRHRSISFCNSPGGWKKDSTGERIALAGISYSVEHYPERTPVTVCYRTPAHDGRHIHSIGEAIEWVYEIEYDSSKQILTKRLFDDNPRPPTPATTWVWRHVSSQALRRVAAPTDKMKTTFEIEAYKGGNLSDLRRFGAILEQGGVTAKKRHTNSD